MNNKPHTEETKKRLRDAANTQWDIWRSDDGSMLSLHADRTSEGTRAAYTNNPDAWKNSEAWCKAHSERTRGKSYPNRGPKDYKATEEHRALLMEASHASEQPGGAKITKAQAAYIKYHMIPAGLTDIQISNLFPISVKSVAYIRIGKTWRWVTEDDLK